MSVKVSGHHFPLLARKLNSAYSSSCRTSLHCPSSVVASSEKSAGGFDYKSVSMSERNDEAFGNLIIKLRV